MSNETVHSDREFMARRDAARERIDELTGAKGGNTDDRLAWFHTVYKEAGGDPAAIPWADLAPKDAIVEWLAKNPGEGRRSIDIGCGLGDNAEALAAAGYRTEAFDLSEDAISWAKERFPESSVSYRSADLFNLSGDWQDAFDLVQECYTIQALDGDLRAKAIEVIAGLVAPGGTLLMINRSQSEDGDAKGPPWPMRPSEWRRFEDYGLKRVREEFYDIERPGRVIPHVRAEFFKEV
ncbi:class I SAM-dependent methyltransferase [Roseibium sp.]|uniref:class I SAM-dependent methyltransferase n=1 Tax=Roseibium sp. TaxID=1936156 RepID=UPI003B52637E